MLSDVNTSSLSKDAATGTSKRWTVGTLSYTTGGLVILFIWLLWGDFAWAMRDRSVPSVLQVLFKKYDASDTLAGFLIGSLPAAIAMLISPIISYKSDRHRGRWGRRIPFLLIPTPIAVLSMLGLAFGPQLGKWVHAMLGTASPGPNATTLLVLGLFWTLFEFACIVANSVFGGLVNDVVPQPVVGRFYGLFRAFSLIAGIVFNFWLFRYAETYYFWIFIAVAVIYGVGFSTMCLNVKEGDYPPPPPEVKDAHAPGWVTSVKTYFVECFGNSYYRWYFIAMMFVGIATAPVNLYSVFYANSLHMSMDDYGKCLALTYGTSLVLAYPLGVLADRFHPLRLSLVMLLLYGVTLAWSFSAITGPRSFGVALVAHGILSGALFTSVASIGQRLLPRARFAELGSAAGIVACIASMILAPAMGAMLDVSGHQYRYTFLVGAVLTGLALIHLFVLYRKFMERGGPKNYIAP